MVRVERDGRVTVQNTGAEPVPVAILFENRGGRIGFRNMGVITDTATFDRPSGGLDGCTAIRPRDGANPSKVYVRRKRGRC